MALYTEISSAGESQTFDWATYETRLAEIQEKYDAGIEQQGDGQASDGQQGSDQQAAEGQQ